MCISRVSHNYPFWSHRYYPTLLLSLASHFSLGVINLVREGRQVSYYLKTPKDPDRGLLLLNWQHDSMLASHPDNTTVSVSSTHCLHFLSLFLSLIFLSRLFLYLVKISSLWPWVPLDSSNLWFSCQTFFCRLWCLYTAFDADSYM